MNVSINYVTWFGPLGISKGRSTIHIWRNIYTNICRIYWRGNQEYQRTMFASNYYLRVWILFFVFISLKFNHLSSFSVHDFSRYVAPSSFITFVRHASCCWRQQLKCSSCSSAQRPLIILPSPQA